MPGSCRVGGWVGGWVGAWAGEWAVVVWLRTSLAILDAGSSRIRAASGRPPTRVSGVGKLMGQRRMNGVGGASPTSPHPPTPPRCQCPPPPFHPVCRRPFAPSHLQRAPWRPSSCPTCCPWACTAAGAGNTWGLRPDRCGLSSRAGVLLPWVLELAQRRAPGACSPPGEQPARVAPGTHTRALPSLRGSFVVQTACPASGSVGSVYGAGGGGSSRGRV